MNFELEAERLMAATTPNHDGSIGVDWHEWKDRYMGSDSMEKERTAIAEYLKGFYNAVVRDANEKMAEAEWKKINAELERFKQKP